MPWHAAGLAACQALGLVALFARPAAAQVYSTLAPGFRCTVQDTTCAVLGDLYAATGGNAWTEPSYITPSADIVGNWTDRYGKWTAAAAGNPTSYCALWGVVCDTTGTRVDELSLLGVGMVGTLPASLGMLPSTMIKLNFQNCPEPCTVPKQGQAAYATRQLLTGPIPDISSLSRLVRLGMSGNGLTGSLPAYLGQFSYLSDVGLNQNLLSGTVPNTFLPPNIHYVNAGYNRFTGTLPVAWANASSLEYLYLNSNALTGTIPSEWASLSRLSWLLLYGNNLTGSLPSTFATLPRLEYVILNNNTLAGTLPAWLPQLSELKYLDLSFNAFNGSFPPSWGGMTSLSHLLASDNRLTGTLPTSLGNLTGLLTLELQNNQLYGSLPAGWASVSKPTGNLGMSLDPTLCSDQNITYLEDYVDYATVVQLPYGLSAQCPPRPCPASSWSASGMDTDGSAGGCTACPAGSAISDLGGVSTNNSLAHAGAARCVADDPSVTISAAGVATCSAGYSGAPMRLANAWTGCCSSPSAVPACQPSAPTPEAVIIGSSVGSVCGFAILLGALIFLRRRIRRRFERDITPVMVKGEGVKASQGAPLSVISTLGSGPSSEDGSLMWRSRPFISRNDEVQLGDKIGEGGYATVFVGTWRGTQVAVKVFDGLAITDLRFGGGGGDATLESQSLTSGVGSDSSSSYIQEVELLSSLRHPNILAIYALVEKPRPMLVIELGAAGSLKDLLGRSCLENLSWAQRIAIGQGVACGVDFLHAQHPPVIHMDLKSPNVVLDKSLNPKVADFGISLSHYGASGGRRVVGGTPRFMAPEVARQEVVTNYPAIDCYGLGMVLNDLAHDNTDDAAPKRLAKAGVDTRSSVTECVTAASTVRWSHLRLLMEREKSGYATNIAKRVPQPLADLMQACLAVDPEQRPMVTAVRERLAQMVEPAKTW